MTRISPNPPGVTDDLVAGLREHGFDDARPVEPTMMVVVENLRSRFNAAAGLTGQGFKDRCEVPARAGEGSAAVSGPQAGGAGSTGSGERVGTRRGERVPQGAPRASGERA
ncbi:carboxymuconolactone decarboxylase family protein [Thermomonospora amylolytica]|uniref:hypothetical protein n=1 Tax=Thermomonospora amylolytica TaxID=1411117 RepID=UPI0018E4F29D|nr:hypothetical protein [Thermomonospora amylolytica]